MTDLSKNWFDLSVNSNILKQTYINGFIDVCNNIVGRENLLIQNEKDIGNTRFGLGTLDPSATIHIMGDDPTIRLTNSSITEPTQNNVNLGRIDFEDKASIRSDVMSGDSDPLGSLIFSTDNMDRLVIGNNRVGLGTIDIVPDGDTLQIIDGGIHINEDNIISSTDFVATDNINIINDMNTTTPSESIKIGETMTITGEGKIGIGTDSPATDLDVLGNVQIDGPVKFPSASAIELTASTTANFMNAYGDGGLAGAWNSNLSITLNSKGVWLISGNWDLRSIQTNGYPIIYSIGIGLGTDVNGTNLALRNLHSRGGGAGYVAATWAEDTDFKAGRTEISTCYVNTSTSTKIYMGHLLGSNHNYNGNVDNKSVLRCSGSMRAVKLSNLY